MYTFSFSYLFAVIARTHVIHPLPEHGAPCTTRLLQEILHWDRHEFAQNDSRRTQQEKNPLEIIRRADRTGHTRCENISGTYGLWRAGRRARCGDCYVRVQQPNIMYKRERERERVRERNKLILVRMCVNYIHMSYNFVYAYTCVHVFTTFRVIYFVYTFSMRIY